MLLSRPGTSVRLLLESTADQPEDERVYVELLVLDRGTHMWLTGLSEAKLPSFEIWRRAIGRCVSKIEGLKSRPGNEPWEMQKDPDGYLTNESAEFLLPLHGEIGDLIVKSATLTPVERKNS